MAVARSTPGAAPVCFSHSQLVYFVRIAEDGQISRAARNLYIAQPALSQAIGRLERRLGVALLERHPRGVALTEAGARFLPKAKEAVAAGQEAAAAAQALARGGRGAVEIGFLSSPPPLSVPGLLEQFAAAYPDVEVSFRELPFPTAPVSAWLGDVDIALCYSPVHWSGVESLALRSEPRAALLLNTHPLAARPRLLARDVLDESFCGYAPAVEPSWSAFWTLDDHRGGPVELTADNCANAMELVAALTAGRSITTLPLSIGRTVGGIVPRLAVRPLADAAPACCSLVWRTAAENPLAHALVEVARGRLEGHPG